jgi:regulator of sirC expression with transglutaminase-like and TPR domain
MLATMPAVACRVTKGAKVTTGPYATRVPSEPEPKPSATTRFAELVRGPAASLSAHLDEAVLLIAAHAREGVDVASYIAALDELAAGVTDASVDAIVRHLFGAEGFRGNVEEYYDPRNSYLDQVIDRRLGIPITLAVVMMEVAKRVGVEVEGVGMPGHFLVRDGATLRDPFEGGRPLSVQECEARFHTVHGADAPFHPSLLEPADAAAIVARILANLRQVHLSRRDSNALEWVLRLRGLLPAATIEERAERAGVLAALGRFDEAADVLDALAPDAGDDRARQLLGKAKQLRARLN